MNSSCHLILRDDAGHEASSILLFDRPVGPFDGLMFEYDYVLDCGVRIGTHMPCDGFAAQFLGSIRRLAHDVSSRERHVLGSTAELHTS